MPPAFHRRLTLIWALGCVAFALRLGAQEPTQQPTQQAMAVQKHFEAALRDQQAGALDAAASEYREVIRLDPHLAEAYANLGLVDYARSEFQESAKALTMAARLKPELTGVTLWLGVDLIKLGQPKRAVPLLREAVRRDPSDRQAEKWLGTALWNAGDTFAALDQLAKTSGKYPSDTESCFVLGEAYRKAANYQVEALLASATGTPLLHQVYGDIYKDQHSWIRAAAHYRRASEQDPSWKGAHLGLAEIDLAQDKLPEAENELHYELKVDPSSAAAKALMGKVELLHGHVADALKWLREAIQASPYGASAPFGLSDGVAQPQGEVSADDTLTAQLRGIYAELQQSAPGPARDLAFAVIDQRLATAQLSTDFANYEKLVGKVPVAKDAYLRALGDVERGRFREAESILRIRVRERPHDLQARYLLARTLKYLSSQTLDRLIVMNPASARVHQLLGQTYEDRDDDDKALAEYRTVETMEPTLPGIHYEIGNLLWKFGDRANALKELHQELKLNPTHAEANGEIGSILVVEGEPVRAIPYLETALRIDPGLFLVHQQLGRAYMLQKNYARAAEELEKAARDDLDGSAHYELGMVYRKMGRPEDAAREIEICAKIRAERFEREKPAAPGSYTSVTDNAPNAVPR